MDSSVLIHMRNGDIVETIVDGMRNRLSEESIRTCKREGKIVFDRNVETNKGVFERFTLYDWNHE